MNGSLSTLSMATLLAAAFLVPTGASAGTCDADLDVRLDTKEPNGDIVHMQFWVGVRAREDCARIQYDLILEIRMANGQVRRVRKPKFVKLNDGSLEEVVKAEISVDERLLSYEVRLVECNKCSLG